MSSDESDEFEGFTQGEIDEAEARYQQQLRQLGIGDDSDGQIESGDSDIDENIGPAGDAENIGPAGDAEHINGWHEQFRYHDRGMPHLFTPNGITGPTQNMQDKDPIDLSDMLVKNLIEETDRYARLQKQQHPNENKMAWVRPTLAEMNAFLGHCFQMGIDRKPSTRMYWSTDAFLQTPSYICQNNES